MDLATANPVRCREAAEGVVEGIELGGGWLYRSTGWRKTGQRALLVGREERGFFEGGPRLSWPASGRTLRARVRGREGYRCRDSVEAGLQLPPIDFTQPRPPVHQR